MNPEQDLGDPLLEDAVDGLNLSADRRKSLVEALYRSGWDHPDAVQKKAGAARKRVDDADKKAADAVKARDELAQRVADLEDTSVALSQQVTVGSIGQQGILAKITKVETLLKSVERAVAKQQDELDRMKQQQQQPGVLITNPGIQTWQTTTTSTGTNALTPAQNLAKLRQMQDALNSGRISDYSSKDAQITQGIYQRQKSAEKKFAQGARQSGKSSLIEKIFGKKENK